MYSMFSDSLFYVFFFLLLCIVGATRQVNLPNSPNTAGVHHEVGGPHWVV